MFPPVTVIGLRMEFQDLRQVKADTNWLADTTRSELCRIFSACFAGIQPVDYLHKYFLADDCFERRLRLFRDHGKLVGYCLINFRHHQSQGQRAVHLITASAGFLPSHRHGNHTVTFSLQCAVRHLLTHPFTPIYYADTMLSPAMYRVMAKHMAEIYPAPDRTPPLPIQHLIRDLVPQAAPDGLSHVLYTGRKSDYSADDLQRFQGSDKPEIRFYLRTNPQFNEGYALLTIIPVTFKQLWQSALKRRRG